MEKRYLFLYWPLHNNFGEMLGLMQTSLFTSN